MAKVSHNPTALKTTTPGTSEGCESDGRGWIRTNEGISHQIYSLSPEPTEVKEQSAVTSGNPPAACTPPSAFLASALPFSESIGGSIRTYFIQGESGGNIKIGRARNVWKRLQDLQGASPVRLVVLASLPGDREYELHCRFRRHRQHGEWFAPCDELVKFVQSVQRRQKRKFPPPVGGAQ